MSVAPPSEQDVEVVAGTARFHIASSASTTRRADPRPDRRSQASLSVLTGHCEHRRPSCRPRQPTGRKSPYVPYRLEGAHGRRIRRRARARWLGARGRRRPEHDHAGLHRAGYGAQGQPPGGTAPDPAKGGHVGRNGQRETLLTGDTAAKVRAAALARVPGATVERVETDADHGSPYEAHLRKSDGSELEVLVDKDFAVTAVNTMRH
jgi:hypothetical protein